MCEPPWPTRSKLSYFKEGDDRQQKYKTVFFNPRGRCLSAYFYSLLVFSWADISIVGECSPLYTHQNVTLQRVLNYI